MKRLLFVVAACLLAVPPVLAQQVPPTSRAAVRALPAASRAQVAPSDTLLRFRTRAVPGGRYDTQAGVLRAQYRIAERIEAATPEAAADAFLRQAAPRFGWAAAPDDLEQVRLERGSRSTHVVYQQTYEGLPVFGRRVQVNLDAGQQPTFVTSGYAPHLRTAALSTSPSLTAPAAQAAARQAVSTVGAATSEATLGVVPSSPPRLAWRVVAWPEDAAAEWEVLVDAQTGAVLQLLDLSTHAHQAGAPSDARFAPPQPSARQAARATVTGSGLVFDPDPLTTAGATYGPPYVDADDADLTELNAQRLDVALPDITQGTDGLYRLEGPYAVVDGSINITYAPPAEPSPDAFRYGRSDQHFEAVMVYYHLDRSQRYLQSLGLDRDVQNGPIHVNPHGLGASDNSKYFPSTNSLAFGDGGIDDAEDADVIWHEYGHALLEASAPGLLRTTEGVALHEGWSDYWAASYSRFLEESGKVPTGDWRKVFTWDGNEFWNGRRLDATGRYPDDMIGQPHTDGLLWATTLMQIYDELGRTVTDRLTLLSHAYLSAPVTLADAAEALLQADRDYYGGVHLPVLLQYLGDRGFVDATSYGPALAHDPIGYTEAEGATLPVQVTIVSTAPLTNVQLRYGFDGGALNEALTLTDVDGSGTYEATLTLPTGITSVQYYLQATDANGTTSSLPVDAPSNTFSFGVGPDTVPPTITHTPLDQVFVDAWPPEIVAVVDDNQGVDQAALAWTLRATDGTPVRTGTLPLTRQAGTTTYTGSFRPIDGLEPGMTVEYSLSAIDVASTPNKTRLPETGTFSFPLAREGAVATYTFETPNGTPTGAWTQGAPTYTLGVAHSGSGVWSTGLDGPYPAAAQRSTLTLPPLNLGGVAEPVLVFWHWHDTEHNGGAGLGGVGTPYLWDGGNVKASTDGGATWTVLTPEGGYTATISDATGNPMGGEPGWGAYSYGWQRAVVPLPTGPDVRLRFDFGTDATNSDDAQSLAFAGWALDDVAILTQRPTDTTAPTVLSAPSGTTIRPAGQPYAPLVVEANDATGVASVRVTYEAVTAEGTFSGTERLAMRLDALGTFEGALPLDPGTVGDVVTYRFTLRDPDGNETIYPAPSDPALRIDVRLVERSDALAGLQPTGAWDDGDAWSAQPDGSTPVSSLVLAPLDLPTDAALVQLELDHAYAFPSGYGGNVKLSTDGGATWTALEPEGGYDATLVAPGHPMDGERLFTGTAADGRLSVFDLTPYAGQQARFRVDFAAAGADAEAIWTVRAAVLTFLGTATTTEGFTVPRTLALHPNFPDPFRATTTVEYTLPESMPVTLAAYDLLGRRVALLVEGRQPAGTHRATLDASGLASGVYLLRLVAGGTQQTERMIVAR